MNIQVEVTEKDYIAFNIHHAFHSKQGKKTLLQGRLMAAYISFFSVIVFLIARADTALILTELALLVIASVIWYCMYPGIYKKNIRKQVEKLRQQGKLPYTEKAEISFGDTEIVETTASSVKRIAYADVVSVQTAEGYTYVYIGAIEALIIPDRCAGDMRDELIVYLAEKCGEDKIRQ